MKQRAVAIFASVLLVLLAVGTMAPAARAQERLNDKDIENTIRNLHQDAGKFRSSFDSAIKKSTIRKTSQEKDSRALVKRFDRDTKALLEHFRHTKKADPDLPNLLAASEKIDRIINDAQLEGAVTSDWATVKTELATLSRAFHMPSAGL